MLTSAAPVLSGLAPIAAPPDPVVRAEPPALPSAFDALTFDPPVLPPAAPAVADQVSGPLSFDAMSFDASPVPEAASAALVPVEPAPVPDVPLFDPNALFDPPPYDPAEPAALPAFDPFLAAGGSVGDDGPGAAFDALHSPAGADPAFDAWDAMATDWPAALSPAPALPIGGDGPDHEGSAGSRIPRLSARLGRPGRDPGAAPRRRLRGEYGVPVTLIRNVVIGVVVLVGLGAFSMALVRADRDARAGATSTTLDPKAPPPIGQLPLAGGRTSVTTLPGPAIVSGWTAFESPDGMFSASFPAAPEARETTESTPGGTVTGRVVEARAGDARFVVAAYDIPDGVTFDVRAAVGATGTVDAGPYEVGPGQVASSFQSPPGSDWTLRGFTLIRPNRAYVVVAVGASDADFHPFIHGFQVRRG